MDLAAEPVLAALPQRFCRFLLACRRIDTEGLRGIRGLSFGRAFDRIRFRLEFIERPMRLVPDFDLGGGLSGLDRGLGDLDRVDFGAYRPDIAVLDWFELCQTITDLDRQKQGLEDARTHHFPGVSVHR